MGGRGDSYQQKTPTTNIVKSKMLQQGGGPFQKDLRVLRKRADSKKIVLYYLSCFLA